MVETLAYVWQERDGHVRHCTPLNRLCSPTGNHVSLVPCQHPNQPVPASVGLRCPPLAVSRGDGNKCKVELLPQYGENVGKVARGAGNLSLLVVLQTNKEGVDARQRNERNARMRTWEPWKSRTASSASSFWISCIYWKVENKYFEIERKPFCV
jgi:hypothetical protein